MSIELHWVEQGSEEWLQAREDMYTGSNAHKLLSSIADPNYAKARDSGFSGNFWTKRGHLLEEEAVELYEAIKGVKVERPGFVTNTKYPGCLYSPDGWPPEPFIEVKCFSPAEHKKLITGDIDIKIMAQIQYGYMITEKKLCDFIAYCPKKDPETGRPYFDIKDQFKIIPIARNPRAIANIKSKVKRFSYA